MNAFTIDFDFTTFHRGSKCVGRNGSVDVTADLTLSKVKEDIEGVDAR